jgi:hypothetical protein
MGVIHVPLPPMLGLVIVDHQTGVNDARNPAEQGQQQAQDETQDPAGHQDSDRRENNAKEITQRFQRLPRLTFFRPRAKSN